MRVSQGRDHQGKRLIRSKTVHGTKRDAERLLGDLLKERDLGLVVIDSDRTRVGALLDAVLGDYRINGKRLDFAEVVINVHLRPFFGDMAITKVSTAAVRQYVAERQAKGRANATINNELANLRRAFNLGRRCTPPMVAITPFIPMLEVNNARKGYFEDGDYQALLLHLPDYLQPVLTFAYETGCRRGEILSLEWRHVDLQSGFISLDPGSTKNGEPRMIPLTPTLKAVLGALKSARDEQWPECKWVFQRAGRQILDFRAAWHTACTLAGLIDKHGNPVRLFHDLRRTGLRNLVRAGVPDVVAMAVSGHKTRSVFDRYNIVAGNDLKHAADRLEKYLAEQRKKEGWHT